MDIAIEKLEGHPKRANSMAKGLQEKLVAQIEASGQYPPLIVRPLAGGRFQILDGHQRAAALSRLGRELARCEVWEVGDDRATELLLTLNALRGKDDPRKRGALVAALPEARGLDDLAKVLPENATKLAKLVAYTKPPPPPRAPMRDADMPHPVTFFLTSAQRRGVLRALRKVCADRATALVKMTGGHVP